jgi:DNA-binding CsgD family transcriptional regulator
MSSKEISLMMSMEPKSVDMARYRLRKKLNLNASDNLTEFLGKI